MVRASVRGMTERLRMRMALAVGVGLVVFGVVVLNTDVRPIRGALFVAAGVVAIALALLRLRRLRNQ